MFKSPKAAPPPPPPVVEDTDATKQEYQDMLRKRRGRASSILSKTGQPVATAAKTLLGG